MSATKNWLHDYNQALDSAWDTLETAIIQMKALNDQLYTETGEMKARAPRADVRLLTAKVQELWEEMATMTSAQEPPRPTHTVSGPIRLDFDRMLGYVS